MRRTETISRQTFLACLESLDADDRNNLLDFLTDWDGGDTCEWVQVDVDSLDRIDSQSSPRPADPPETALDRSAAATARETDGRPEPIHPPGMGAQIDLERRARMELADLHASRQTLLEACQRIARQDYAGQTQSDGAHLAEIARAAIAQAAGEGVQP